MDVPISRLAGKEFAAEDVDFIADGGDGMGGAFQDVVRGDLVPGSFDGRGSGGHCITDAEEKNEIRKATGKVMAR